jgi:small subunit ribosomal protein S21|tara:strand:- start:665 stop:910 length:246 start_codon:yes stop_codon:yes gene_type:complete
MWTITINATTGNQYYYMLIIKIEKKTNIEKALKQLKSKVIRTKQSKKLRDNKHFSKRSEKKRLAKGKAIYLQQKWDTENQD